jgi:hypothetical protein
MALSDELQHLVIEVNNISKIVELFWIAFQSTTTVTMEHVITSLYVLRKQMEEVEQHLQKVLETVEKEEVAEVLIEDS